MGSRSSAVNGLPQALHQSKRPVPAISTTSWQLEHR
jgi:hypothetical protein